MSVDIVREFADTNWSGDGPTRGVEEVVEAGLVLSFPHLSFALSDAEKRFLDPRWADGKAKNISVRWPAHTGTEARPHPSPAGFNSTHFGPAVAGELRGAAADASPTDLIALQAMIERYADQAEVLALRLFPHYAGSLRRGNTSFRPVDVAGRQRSWRQDDTRLHIDAFPSNPMQGTRLLRVFCNVNPSGQARRWRVGEPFEAHARRYLAQLSRPLPGAAWLMQRTGVTKRLRTEYDHVMLQLHDLAKADVEFQRAGPQAEVAFAPGTTWVVYSDQVLHAAMGGQHLLEQTFQLDPDHLWQPQTAPLRVLERLLARPLR